MNKHTFNVLVCPLNWGLGHAARCIPVIRELQRQGCNVLIAADGQAYHLLRAELPHLDFVRLRDVSVRYHKKGMSMLMMAMQIPAMLNVIRREQMHVDEIVRRHDIHGIVSDNRYGCFSSRTENVIITHQLQPVMPAYLRRAQPFIARWVAGRLSRFGQVWIPDIASEPGLSGDLSRNDYDLNAVRTGLLSRLPEVTPASGPGQTDVLAILGGPEPQRTVFEDLLIGQMRAWPTMQFTLLRGLPGAAQEVEDIPPHIRLISHCDPPQFAARVSEAKHIVARSGYSTLMDLTVMGRSACLVPTPGQTEQEYLADRMHRMGWFAVQRQSTFRLESIWNPGGHGAFPVPVRDEPGLSDAVSSLIGRMANLHHPTQNFSTFKRELGSIHQD